MSEAIRPNRHEPFEWPIWPARRVFAFSENTNASDGARRRSKEHEGGSKTVEGFHLQASARDSVTLKRIITYSISISGIIGLFAARSARVILCAERFFTALTWISVFSILFDLAGQRAVWLAAASALAPVEGINIASGASEDFYLRLRRDEKKGAK